MDMTVAQIPWPQNAMSNPVTTRTPPMMRAASPETNGTGWMAKAPAMRPERFGSGYK